MAKVVIVGIDGASFNFLLPMLEEGTMPNLKILMETGCYGTLKSQLPPSTCPAWKAYSTGKNFGKLGAFGWVNVDFKNERMYVNTASNIKAKEVWDYLSDEGKKVCAINMPLTYPPKKVNGYIVSATLQRGLVNYTYPKEFRQEIEKKIGYRLHDSHLPIDKFSKQLEEEIKAIIKSRFDLALYKLKEVDFLHLSILKSDTVMHSYWGDDFMSRVFQFIDKQIGLLWKASGEDCDFIVMSDHGFQKLDSFFYANNWLKEKGYLVEKKSVGNLFNTVSISRQRLSRLASKLHILWLLRKAVPKSVTKAIKNEDGEIGWNDTMYLIDWRKSKAICQYGGVFYIKGDQREQDETGERLAAELLKVKNPKTGESIVERVLTKDQAYNGNNMQLAPQLIAIAKQGIEISGRFGKKELFSKQTHWKAVHALDGFFVFNGKSFDNCKAMQEASLLDLMPTSLHLLGCKVPTDIDGTVLERFFKKESDAAKRQVQKREPLPETAEENFQGEEKESQRRLEEEAEIEKELQRLGYLK